ncbi:Rho GTPase activation protein [Sergentomyia squamirostris]
MMNMKRYPSQGKVNSSSSVVCELLQRSPPSPPIPRQRTSLKRYANDWTFVATKSELYENLKFDGEYCEIEGTSGTSGENIYENICEKCGRIFAGDQCGDCTKPPSGKSSKKFVDFFGSLKRRQKAESRRKKIEIIHNVDGFDGVFSTRETFDLAEISQLKEEFLREETPHTYGRIQSHTDQTTLYENVSTTSSTTATSSCDEVRDSSLAAWMISLRWEVVDYADHCAISVKSVPSRIPDNLSPSSQYFSEYDEDFTQHVLIFIQTLSEKTQRRRKKVKKIVEKSLVQNSPNSLAVVPASTTISSFNPFDFLNRIFLSIGINTALLDFNNELIVFCLQTQNWRQNSQTRVDDRDSELVMQILSTEDSCCGKCLNTDMSTDDRSISPISPQQPKNVDLKDTNDLNTLPGRKAQTLDQDRKIDFNIKCSEEIKDSTDKIYHPIWKFHTVGIGREAVSVDTFECSYNSDDFIEEIDAGEWEIAEEFEFSSSRECLAVEEIPEVPQTSLYRTICILFSKDHPHVNRFIYDYKSHHHTFEHPISPTSQRIIENTPTQCSGSNLNRNFPIPDSVMAWKFMLLSANYPEDEEDVNISPLEAISQSFNDSLELLKAKGSKYSLGRRPKDDSDVITCVEYKCEQLGRFSQSVSNLSTLSNDSPASPTHSSSTSSPPLETKKLPKKTSPIALIRLKREEKPKPVFGKDLQDVRLDPDLGVPRFIVKCIEIIEEEENIKTNGIYRASGNKILIEEVRKKMNEKHNFRKDYIWNFLEKQDVHTLTGSLKMFFRNLTTQLIPDEVFERLPQPLDESSVTSLKAEIESLPEVNRKTLNYLISHLIRVTRYSDENFMNSGNLSICWGACIFASSQKAVDMLDTHDVIRKNYLIKLLIDKYDSIFDQIS